MAHHPNQGDITREEARGPGALRLRVVGVTGRPASGKSTLLLILQDLGFKTTSSDRLVHRLFQAPSPLAPALARAFGPQVVDPKGGIVREVLRRAATQDPHGLARLEGVVHPKARELLLQEVEEARLEGAEWLFVEVPLLFEAGWDRLCWATVAVVCPEGIRLERLRARGIPPRELEALEERHLPQEEKAARAHMVVENRGGPEELRRAARRLLRELGALPLDADEGA